ncbi:MAG: NUDIX domain-containing protein [Sphingobium sp.]|nr:NUDIX domain-containing protein [Sphingobium sp.]
MRLDPAPDARPAATVILLRDRNEGPPDLLLMERASSMVFAPGALVFPGGAVDPGDAVLAAHMAADLPPDEGAARVAAVRETLEESGLGIGFPDDFPAERLIAMRRAMAEGASFGTLLDAEGVALDLSVLLPFARWHPAAFERARRAYDTRFYLTRAPRAQEALADANETVHLFWSGAAAALARCDAGEGKVIFPTRRNLERLAQYRSFEEAASHAAAIPATKITPWFEDREGERHLCIPDDLGYPVTSELLARAVRH